MKKFIATLMVLFTMTFVSYGQTNCGMNIGYSVNNFFKMGCKLWHNNMIYGMDCGVNVKSPFVGKDYSNIIGINTYPDEQQEIVSYNSCDFNILVGYTLYKGLYVGGLLGFACFEKGVNSYDEHHILSSTGFYSFRTEKKCKINYGGVIGCKYKKIDFAIGYTIVESAFLTIGYDF